MSLGTSLYNGKYMVFLFFPTCKLGHNYPQLASLWILYLTQLEIMWLSSSPDRSQQEWYTGHKSVAAAAGAKERHNTY